MSLSNRQKRYLRGLSHQLKPVVMIGEKGLSDTVREEIETALKHHELVKIRLRVPRQQRQQMISDIARDSAAEKVHSIGQVACFFRRNPEQPKVVIPA